VVLARLDGLLVHCRGKNESQTPRPIAKRITNNLVLKKLRVAFDLKDVATPHLRGRQPVSKPELSALFRQPDHRNLRQCGDQMLRNFLKGFAPTRTRKLAGVRPAMRLDASFRYGFAVSDEGQRARLLPVQFAVHPGDLHVSSATGQLRLLLYIPDRSKQQARRLPAESFEMATSIRFTRVSTRFPEVIQ
jgi:hypothetical protein